MFCEAISKCSTYGRNDSGKSEGVTMMAGNQVYTCVGSPPNQQHDAVACSCAETLRPVNRIGSHHCFGKPELSAQIRIKVVGQHLRILFRRHGT
eukprot:1159147-Pelagomonas_calceolata.AAC.5